MRETIGLKALHAAALMVDANQQVAADFLHLGAQGAELLTVFPVAGEQNNAAGQRMLEPLTISFGQREAGNVDDERRVLARGVRGHVGLSCVGGRSEIQMKIFSGSDGVAVLPGWSACSTTTKLAA